MGIIHRMLTMFAGESGELQKVRADAEKRRAAKSSALNPKVDGDPLNRIVAALQKRIDRGN